MCVRGKNGGIANSFLLGCLFHITTGSACEQSFRRITSTCERLQGATVGESREKTKLSERKNMAQYERRVCLHKTVSFSFPHHQYLTGVALRRIRLLELLLLHFLLLLNEKASAVKTVTYHTKLCEYNETVFETRQSLFVVYSCAYQQLDPIKKNKRKFLLRCHCCYCVW